MREEHLETTRPAREPVRRVLMARLHWVALAAALVLWGLHLGGVVFPRQPERDAVAAGIEERWEALRARTQGSFLNVPDEQRVFEDLATEVAAAYGKLPPGPAPAGDVTYSEDILALARQGARNEILFLPPKDLQLDVRRGSIVLNWVEDADNNVPVSQWEVLRSSGEGPFESLARVPAAASTYEDKDVKAGLSYGYRVRALTQEPSIAPDARISQPSEPRRAEATADFRLTLVGGDPQAGKAEFDVEKWHANAWSLRRFTVGVGESIGARDPVSGIDYTTPRLLKSLGAETVTETHEVEEVTFDAEGHVRLQGGEPVVEPVKVTEEFRVLEAVVEGGAQPPQTLQHRQKT